MREHPPDTVAQTYARTVGALYLTLFLLGPLAFFLGRNSVMVRGDPLATAANVVASQGLSTAVPALLLLRGTGDLAAFDPDQVAALVVLSMEVNAFLVLVWGLLFGFHLALLGVLVYRSTFWPKTLGVLLAVAAVGYLAQGYGHLLAPQFDPVLSRVAVLLAVPGELAFAVWLLWKGVDPQRWTAFTQRA